MKKQTIIGLLFLIAAVNLQARPQQEVPYTLEDRDRMIRIEARMEALERNMAIQFEAQEVRFNSQQKQLDDLKTMFYWGFGIMITLFIFMMGYLIWDRRTALRPALDKASSADDKTKNLINALREYAKKNPELADILRAHGLF